MMNIGFSSVPESGSGCPAGSKTSSHPDIESPNSASLVSMIVEYIPWKPFRFAGWSN